MTDQDVLTNPEGISGSISLEDEQLNPPPYNNFMTEGDSHAKSPAGKTVLHDTELDGLLTAEEPILNDNADRSNYRGSE